MDSGVDDTKDLEREIKARKALIKRSRHELHELMARLESLQQQAAKMGWRAELHLKPKTQSQERQSDLDDGSTR